MKENVLLIALVCAVTGTHMYVLDFGTVNGQVYGFNIGSRGVTGSAISGTPVAAGVGPLAGIVIDPTGALLAAEALSSNNISLYATGSGGTLTPQTPVSTGHGPVYVTLYNAP